MFAQQPSPLPIKMSLAVAITLTSFGTCEKERTPLPAPMVAAHRNATIYYTPGDTDPVPDMLDELDQIAGRLWSDLSLRVLVLASANEGRDIDHNLTLAAARARNVRRELIARGVSERQIIVAAREAPADDPKGARCDIEPLHVARTASPAVIE